MGANVKVEAMCNLYRMTKSAAEVARLFNVKDALAGANMGSEIYPGHPGAVIAEGTLQAMVWGLPLQMKSKTGKLLKAQAGQQCAHGQARQLLLAQELRDAAVPDPADRLGRGGGREGAMTRSWMQAGSEELFACAGVWRDSEEWGRSYAMVMTDAVGDAAQVHARMPVILEGDAREAWVTAKPAEAIALCVGYDGARRHRPDGPAVVGRRGAAAVAVKWLIHVNRASYALRVAGALFMHNELSPPPDLRRIPRGLCHGWSGAGGTG